MTRAVFHFAVGHDAMNRAREVATIPLPISPRNKSKMRCRLMSSIQIRRKGSDGRILSLERALFVPPH